MRRMRRPPAVELPARRTHGHGRRWRVRLTQRPHEFGEGLVVEQLRAHERERFGLVHALIAKLGVAQLEVLGKLVDDFSLARGAEAQAREP